MSYSDCTRHLCIAELSFWQYCQQYTVLYCQPYTDALCCTAEVQHGALHCSRLNQFTLSFTIQCSSVDAIQCYQPLPLIISHCWPLQMSAADHSTRLKMIRSTPSVRLENTGPKCGLARPSSLKRQHRDFYK